MNQQPGVREKQWLSNYRKLKEYYDAHGHADVPSHSDEYPQLGRWVSKLRMNERKLNEKQRKLLEKVGFSWSDDVENKRHEKFMERYRELLAYKRKNGDCNVPSKTKDDKYKKLGRWLEVLRANERAGNLDDWKKDLLTRAGVLWSMDLKDQESLRWNALFERLKLFFDTYGHSNVPENWEEDAELAKWVVSQRRRKKPLTAPRKKLLEELDFRWNNQPLKRGRDDKGRYLPV